MIIGWSLLLYMIIVNTIKIILINIMESSIKDEIKNYQLLQKDAVNDENEENTDESH